jgi:penicillin-binding protein 1A
MNAAALALGGMTKGISPLEMAGAYSIFPNEGKYTEPVTYTKITNNQGGVLLDRTQKQKAQQVLDPGVAFITTDILSTVVTKGLGKDAAIYSQPVAGKTGTTNDNFDAWFAGCTPQYSAALWIGNDVNIELSVGSSAAAELWAKIMGEICKGTARGEFPAAPENVTRVGGEYYIKGTNSTVVSPLKNSSETTEKETDDAKNTLPSQSGTSEQTTQATQPPATKPTEALPTEEPTTDSP